MASHGPPGPLTGRYLGPLVVDIPPDTDLPIHVFIREGQITEVERLLTQDPQRVNSRDGSGLTPLMVAAEHNTSPSIARILLKSGANVTLQDNDGITAAMYACRDHDMHISVLEAILENHEPHLCLSFADKWGWTAVHYAVKGCSTKCLRLLYTVLQNLDQTPPHDYDYVNNLKDSIGRTPLIVAAKYLMGSDIAIPMFLLHMGANVNVQDHNGMTAAMHACQEQDIHLEVLKAILPRLPGTHDTYSLDIQDTTGWTALHHAVFANSEECLRYMLIYLKRKILIKKMKKKIINSWDSSGSTALILAAKYHSTSYIARALLEHSADINVKDNFGMTAIMHACQENDKRQSVLDAILATKRTHSEYLDLDTRDRAGKTALDHAEDGGSRVCYRNLWLSGARNRKNAEPRFASTV